MRFTHLAVTVLSTFGVGALTVPTANDAILESRATYDMEHSDLTINAFNLVNCDEGDYAYTTFYNVTYGLDYPVITMSYNLSRNLVAAEQLDMSTFATNPSPSSATAASVSGMPTQCALFQETVVADDGGPVSEGCHTLNTKAQCFSLWHH